MYAFNTYDSISVYPNKGGLEADEIQEKNVILLVMLLIIGFLVIMSTRETEEYVKESKKEQPDFAYESLLQDNDGIIVLCYHRVLKDTPITSFASTISQNSQLHEYNVFLEDFEKQMEFLKENHISVLTSEQLISKINKKEVIGKAVVITFDDIDKSLTENAYPVMKEFDLPFTQFIITGKVGQTIDGSQMSSWKEIKEMDENPLVISGLHTNDLHYQENLEPVLSTNISKKVVQKDYLKSQKTFQEELNKKGNVFAYPYGAQNKDLENYMLKDGISGIFTLSPGVVTNETKYSNIPRLIVTKENWKTIEHWLVKK